MLSVIIPTFNEMETGYLKNILPCLAQIDDLEVIVVDSLSTDGTVEYVNSFPFIKLYQIQTTSRAARLNLGIERSKGSMLLLHHPRSVIELDGIKYLRDNENDYYWGGFTHKFDLDNNLLKLTSWYSNKIRADFKNIFYLDHCIFMKKELFEIVGKIPEVDIFEDTLLSKRLRSICEGFRLDYFALTSAIRFQKNGMFLHAFNNQILKLKYFLNTDHKKMNKSYENRIALNARYDNSDD